MSPPAVIFTAPPPASTAERKLPVTSILTEPTERLWLETKLRNDSGPACWLAALVRIAAPWPLVNEALDLIATAATLGLVMIPDRRMSVLL